MVRALASAVENAVFTASYASTLQPARADACITSCARDDACRPAPKECRRWRRQSLRTAPAYKSAQKKNTKWFLYLALCRRMRLLSAKQGTQHLNRRGIHRFVIHVCMPTVHAKVPKSLRIGSKRLREAMLLQEAIKASEPLQSNGVAIVIHGRQLYRGALATAKCCGARSAHVACIESVNYSRLR